LIERKFMPNLLMRTATAVGLALTVVALAGAPAGAATATISASVSNGVVTVPSSTNVTLGDTVTLANTTGTPAPAFAVLGDATCDANSGFNYGVVGNGQIVTLGTFATPTWQAGDVAHFSILFNAVCTPFDVAVVAASPPPDVAETPYIAGLLGAAVLIFGIGFVAMRRRRHRPV
jgi:plastocyanin